MQSGQSPYSKVQDKEIAEMKRRLTALEEDGSKRVSGLETKVATMANEQAATTKKLEKTSKKLKNTRRQLRKARKVLLSGSPHFSIAPLSLDPM